MWAQVLTCTGTNTSQLPVCAVYWQVYGGDSVKSVLPSPYQAMMMPGQYQYMARSLLCL